MTTWQHLAWQALRPEARRAEVWRARAGFGLLYATVGGWAAAAPQSALGLGERLRLGFQAIIVLCALFAASSGIRHRTEAMADEHLLVSRRDRNLAKLAANSIKATQDLLPALPFVLFLMAVHAISASEFFSSLILVSSLMLASLVLPGFETSLIVFLGGAAAVLARNRNYFEQTMITLFALHLGIKAMLAWSAISRAQRLRANWIHEALTPLTAAEISGRCRTAIWKRYAIPITALAALNLLVIVALISGVELPAAMEHKLALGFMLLAGTILLFVDASALLAAGLLGGLRTLDPHRAFAMIFASIIGIPWVLAWGFYAMHAGETFTLNEAAAFFFFWVILGSAISSQAGTAARDRLQRDLRNILSENGSRD